MSLRAKIKSRVVSRILGRGWVIGPLAVGVAALGISLVMRLPVPALPPALAVCFGLSAYNAIRIWLTEGATMAGEESEKLERELASDRHATLRELRDALQLAGQSDAVADIETLEQHTDRLERGKAGQGFSIPEAFRPTLDNLRESCLASLRKVVRLGGIGQDLSTEQAKAEVDAIRRGLLAEVHDAITQLGVALDRLQLRAVREDPGDDELPRLRQELDTQLDVARRVEQRLSDLEQRLTPLEQQRG